MHSYVVAPDDVEQSRHQQRKQQQLQPSESLADEGDHDREHGDDAATRRAAVPARKEHPRKSRTIRPDSKRVLRIPEEDWPR